MPLISSIDINGKANKSEKFEAQKKKIIAFLIRDEEKNGIKDEKWDVGRKSLSTR